MPVLGIIVSMLASKQMIDIHSRSDHFSSKKPAKHDKSTSGKTEIKTVGKFRYRVNDLLGERTDGASNVYKGKFDGRDVAIKRVGNTYHTEREINHLLRSAEHKNIVRYHCSEKTAHFTYIALELCRCNLKQFVEDPNFQCLQKLLSHKNLLRHITEGLEHLHNKIKIIHRNINPENILISIPDSTNQIKAMISDFGLSKEYINTRDYWSGNTAGWSAKEMQTNEEITSSVDMFSLGCIIYYVLTGSHPFGPLEKRKDNIKNNNFKLNALDYIYKPLISRLISSNPKQRPSCKVVLRYPIFWSLRLTINFIQHVSICLSERHNTCELENMLCKMQGAVIRRNWLDKIAINMAESIKANKPNYNGNSIKDLLRFIRNKLTHFYNCDETTQLIFCGNEEKFLSYCLQQFPLLLIHTWISAQVLRKSERFKAYYSTGDYIFDSTWSTWITYIYE